MLTEDGKQPNFITLFDSDDEVLFLAGIWVPVGTNTDTRCAILTHPAADSLSSIHDRQPVVLDPGCQWQWLDTNITEREAVRNIARPLDPARLRTYPVPRVNHTKNDDPDLLRQIP